MEKIIGFFGMDAQVGTSMVSQSIAELLAEKNQRVLYICASGKYGDDYFKNKENKSIDIIKAGLINKSIDEAEIDNVMIKKNNLHIIPGIKNLVTVAYYPADTLEPLIKLTEEKYDFIIVDCGENLNLGLNIAAISICNKLFFITTRQPKAIKKATGAYLNILNKLGFQGDVIINKYRNNVALLVSKEMEALFGQQVISKIPYLEHGWEAEIEARTLLRYPKYREPLNELSALILGEEMKSNVKRISPRQIFRKR